MNSTEWVWDPSLGVYFHAPSNTYAINSNGEWTYVLATDFKPGQPSTVRAPQELEDGEVEDDVGWGALMEESPKPKPENAAGDESAQVLRLVVLESDVLDPGKIAMIDSRPEGVQLGRDKQPGQLRVRLKEMAVSKTHAVVYRGEEWCIVDLGSTHGTFVKHGGETHRVSEPKHSSQPRPLAHLDEITIGSTTFSTHIHSDWPCELCQIKGDNVLELSHDDLEVEPKAAEETPTKKPGPRGHHAMSLLKQTLLKDNGVQSDSRKDNKYLDRSRIRREQERASPRRSASPPKPAPQPQPPAFAARMLSQQGWVEGRGLGVQQDGIAEPIAVKANMDKRGLGEDEDDWRERGKKKRWREVQ